VRIGHFHYGIYRPGGICSYLKSISQAELRQGNQVFFFETDEGRHAEEEIEPIKVRNAGELLLAAKDLRLDMLHIHATLFEKIPLHLPIVYTVHTNAPHCPAGGLFLSRSESPCPRRYDLLGCFMSHFTEHCGSMRPNKMFDGFRRRHLESKILARLQVIAVSHFIKRKMVNSGYDAGNIEVLHNFVAVPWKADDAALRRQDGMPVFVYSGRLQPNKGVQWLLRSLARTTQPSRLIIAGSGTMAGRLKTLAVTLGLSDRVSFVGWLNGEALAAVIKSATAIIVPSLWPEPFGLVAIEAGAAGKPVIASSTGALPEIIDPDKTGLLVQPGDERAMSAAIDRLAATPGLAIEMGVQGKRRVEAEFSLPNHLKRLHEIYEEVINRSGGLGFTEIPTKDAALQRPEKESSPS
jgi:glycosyltransferase involved in cell wall biosynthesis